MAVPQQVVDADARADELMKGGQTDQTPQGEQPPGAVDTGEQPPQPTEDYKNQYFTLKGKYDAEVPRLYSELADYKIKMAELASKVNQIQQPPQAQPQPAQAPGEVAYIQKEIPELEKAVKYWISTDMERVINERVNARIAELQNQFAQFRDETVTVAAKTFDEQLTGKVSNWQRINQDPAFLAWLQETDKYSGLSKLALLQNAYQSKDLARTAQFFTDFLEHTKAPVPQAQSKKENYVAPPSASSGSSAPPSAEGTMTREYVKKFYDDMSKGLYRYRRDEAAEIEARINRAMAEGKIV